MNGLVGNPNNATIHQQNASSNIIQPHLSDVKSGNCPVVSTENYKCVNECRIDSDCPRTQKCCLNGCGRSCMEPGSHRETIILTCPPSSHIQICIHICNVSTDCPPGSTCCPQSCGQVCVDQNGFSTTSATPIVQMALDLPSRPVTQALRTTDTASWFTRVPVTNIEIKIQNAMPSTVPQFQQNPYAAAPAASPIASAIPSCPKIAAGSATSCQTKCLTDSDCQRGQICCWNGCGRECVNPNQQSQQLIESLKTPAETRRSTTIRTRAIIGCPEAPSGMAGTCDNECKNDADCPAFHICCNRGCGHMCVKFVQNVHIGMGNRIDSAKIISDYDDIDDEITERTTKKTTKTKTKTTTATTVKSTTEKSPESVTTKPMPTHIVTGFMDFTFTSTVPTTIDQRPLVGSGGGTGVRGTLEPSVAVQMFTESTTEATTQPMTTTSTYSTSSATTTSATSTITSPATTLIASSTTDRATTTFTSATTAPVTLSIPTATSTSNKNSPNFTTILNAAPTTATTTPRILPLVTTRLLPDQPLPGSSPFISNPYEPYIPENALFPHQAATAPPDPYVQPYWPTQRPTKPSVIADRYDAYSGFLGFPSQPYKPVLPNPSYPQKPDIFLPNLKWPGSQYGVDNIPPSTNFPPMFGLPSAYRPGNAANLPNVPISYLFGGSNNFAFNGFASFPSLPKLPAKPPPNLAGIPPFYPDQAIFFGNTQSSNNLAKI